MRVLALAAFPTRMAATRFRVAQFVGPLAQHGIHLELLPFLDDARAARLYDTRPVWGRAASLARAAAALLATVGTRGEYDAVFVQREAMMVGPPIVELLATRLLRVPLVFDFDDAIWLPNGGPLHTALKMPGKSRWLVRRAAHVVAGSEHLARWARAHGAPTSVIPTTVPAALWHPLPGRATGDFGSSDGPPVIGWVGTHSTAPQLAMVRDALERLALDGRAFRVRVVGAGPDFRLPGVAVENVSWQLDTELDEFRRIDVGLAPMFAGPWHEGKCGFKQVQFMAVGVPLVTSLVGGARDFVRDGENALVAADSDGWYRSIRSVLDDRALRMRLTEAGRSTFEASLSSESVTPRLASILRSIEARAGSRRPQIARRNHM